MADKVLFVKKVVSIGYTCQKDVVRVIEVISGNNLKVLSKIILTLQQIGGYTTLYK